MTTKTKTPRIDIKQIARLPRLSIRTHNLTLDVTPKSLWATTCKTCLTSYTTHSHAQALEQARWHLTEMQPCQRAATQPATIHICDDQQPC